MEKAEKRGREVKKRKFSFLRLSLLLLPDFVCFSSRLRSFVFFSSYYFICYAYAYYIYTQHSIKFSFFFLCFALIHFFFSSCLFRMFVHDVHLYLMIIFHCSFSHFYYLHCITSLSSLRALSSFFLEFLS